ncbi:MAG: hypothetical protein ACKVVP_05470 [Chloroflexota bacterium]
MVNVTVSLSSGAYERLARRAQQRGAPPEEITREILEAALSDERTDREIIRGILDAKGLLSKPSARTRVAGAPEISLEEVRDALTATDGPSLSDILLEQRGPKD